MKTSSVFDTICNQDVDIMIGENAKDNWNIIDKANQYDIWFHVENHPSCHVILQLPNKKSTVSKQTLIHCAALCKAGSKVKDQKNITIIYAKRQTISKGEDVGSVITKRVDRIVI